MEHVVCWHFRSTYSVRHLPINSATRCRARGGEGKQEATSKPKHLQKPGLCGFLLSPLVFPSIPWVSMSTKPFYSTVMGPGGMAPKKALEEVNAKPTSLQDPPPLRPGQDRQKWRRDVNSWMAYITRRASVGEKKSLATQATLCYELYNALDASYQSVIDHAKITKSISFDVEPHQQEEAVLKIVSLIGADTSLEIIDRALNAYKNVHMCIRSNSEQPSEFATRFRGLVSQYMSLTGISVTETESQLMAMIMLQNSRLPHDTQNAVKLLLVTQVQQKRASQIAKAVKLSVHDTENLKNYVRDASDIYGKADGIEVPDNNGQSEQRRTLSEADLSRLIDIATNMTHLLQCVTREGDSGHDIYVDDVFNALQSLDSDSSQQKNHNSTSKRTSRDDFHVAVQKATMMAIQNQREYSIGALTVQPRRQSTKLTERKMNSRCHRCKRKGHWKGDAECPMTKRRKISSVSPKDGEADEAIEKPVENEDSLHFQK